MKQKVNNFKQEFNRIIQECQKFCYMARAKEYQIQKIEVLEGLLKKATELKNTIIENRIEDLANAMLSFEDMIFALINELKMWVALKDDDAHAAWEFLVHAQMATRAAMQAHVLASHLEGYANRLKILEKTLFPPMWFVSVGMIIEQSECSICGSEYGECNHVCGRAYMGKHCVRIITKVKKINEISLVKEPADKLCKIEVFTDEEGLTRDFLTWRIIEKKAQEKGRNFR